MAGSTQSQRRGKSQLRPSEVCSRFDVQPYVLKFWESEFPQLGRRLGPKRVYGPRELEIVSAIHELVEEQGLNLSEVRDVLTERFPEDGTAVREEEGASAGQATAPGGAADRADSGSAQGGLFGQAEARIRELEKELERARSLAADNEARAMEQEQRAEQLEQRAQEQASRAEELARQLADAEQARAAAERRVDEVKDEDGARLAEAQEEWEQQLAEAIEEAERRVRAAEDAAEQRLQQAHAESEQRLGELRQQLEGAEADRAAALARADEMESQLGVERGAKEALEQQVEELSSLVESAGQAEQRLEAAREQSEALRLSFEEERREVRQRDAKLAEEVGAALEELHAIEALTGQLLEEISGKPLDPGSSEPPSQPEEEEPSEPEDDTDNSAEAD